MYGSNADILVFESIFSCFLFSIFVFFWGGRGVKMGKAPRGAVHSKAPFLLIGGGYLLSHFRSTIGVAGFNFSVRNGKRWSHSTIATLTALFRQAVSNCVLGY